MLPTICDDTWNMLNMQHITTNYSDILVVVLEKIKGPTHMVESDHHFRKKTSTIDTHRDEFYWIKIHLFAFFLSFFNTARYRQLKVNRLIIGSGNAGIIFLNHPANERQRYIVMSSLIGWAHSQIDPWKWHVTWLMQRQYLLQPVLIQIDNQ